MSRHRDANAPQKPMPSQPELPPAPIRATTATPAPSLRLLLRDKRATAADSLGAGAVALPGRGADVRTATVLLNAVTRQIRS